MTTLCKKVVELKSRLAQRERGAFAIEQALFTSAIGAGCLVLSHELATVAEKGLRIVNQVMP